MIKNMTEGAPSRILWAFSMPMLLSVIFQQLYNIVDSVVAGKFVGAAALAAVGASFPITMIFMAIATGANIGASVVISQLFGARKLVKLKTSISTSILAVLVLAVVLTLAGWIFCRPLLGLLNTPEQIFSDSALYLNIYVGGLVFLFLYNICTGVFTALGDSKTPLYFLIASSLGNILLDLVFVICFHMGVGGVAWATFIAQGVSSVFAFTVLMYRLKGLHPEVRYPRFSASMLAKISRIAVPSILQQSFVSVGNLFIQGRVNSFGADVIAGYAAAVKLNTFAITSFTTLGNAISSFTAQNIGAAKYQRIKAGFKVGCIMMLVVVLPFVLAFGVFGKQMMSIFVSPADVAIIQEGKLFLQVLSPFYIIIGVKLIADGVLRGTGRMVQFMVSTFSDLVLRVALAYILSYAMASSLGIWLSWPVGWSIAAVLSCCFYAVQSRKLPAKES